MNYCKMPRLSHWISYGLIICLNLTSLISAQTALPGVEIRFEEDDGSNVERVYVSYSASVATVPSADSAELFHTKLYTPPSSNLDGCGLGGIKPPSNPSSEKWTIVLRRGGKCSFRDKVRRAEDAGAAAVIIVNTVSGLYNSTTGGLLNTCSLNCDVGFSTFDKNTCEESSRKKHNGKGCFVCSENIRIGSGEFCCVDDSLIDMYLGASIRIPAFFASIESGESVLERKAMDRSSCTISQRVVYEVDPSVVTIGFLGCFVLAIASYRAASKERSLARWIWSPHVSRNHLDQIASGHEDHEHEQMHLAVSDACVFVISSTFTIGFLFFLVQYYPHAVVRVLQFLFALGSMGSLAKFVVTPLLKGCFGPDGNRQWRHAPLFCIGESGHTTLPKVLGLIVAGVFAFTWLFERHEPWAWMFLDILAASICTSFLLTLRVPSLKVGTAVLSAFFFYDIFMVFITPLLFSGKSVMVDVATAGRAREVADATKCIRQPEERVPMLFVVPRFDWYGGYALLGLGDVVLPGLLVVLALRFDYAKLRHRYHAAEAASFPKPSFWQIHAYWIPLMLSYATGLTLTFVANIRGWTFNGVRGQPALLYLVPFTLGCFFFLMWKRGDYSVLWNDAWLDWEHDVSTEQDEEGLTYEDGRPRRYTM